jgi:FkbM family methyltransferase
MKFVSAKKPSNRKAPPFYLLLVVALCLMFAFFKINSEISYEADVSYLLRGLAPTKDSEMLVCLKEVLANLPIGKGRLSHKRNPRNLQISFAHHYDAETNKNKWNANDRFLPMPELETAEHCSVWEVGAFKTADDSQQLLKSYPKCTYHAFEPIKQYYQELEAKWKSEDRVHTHNFGIGGKELVLNIDPASLQNQGTYIGDAPKASQDSSVQVFIKSFDSAIAEADGHVPTLLQMNCEGCEWDFLTDGMEAGFIQKIPIIQVGIHNYGDVGLGGRVWELCEIHQRLSETHVMVKGVPFAWERWVKK